MAFTYSAAIFVVVPVDDVMATILNAPVFTVVLKYLLWAGQGRCFAGYPVGYILAFLAGFFVDGAPFHQECLTYIGEVQVIVEL